MSLPTITVDVPEGVFTYQRPKDDATAAWGFYRRQKDGTFQGAKPPRRFRQIIKKEHRKNGIPHKRTKTRNTPRG